MLIHIVYGYVHAIMAESSSWDRGHMVSKAKNIYCSYYMLSVLSTSPLQKMLLIPGLDDLTYVLGAALSHTPLKISHSIFIYYQELKRLVFN